MLTTDLKNILTMDPKRVVIVVGAGVTIGALRGSGCEELASWRGLLASGIRHCEDTYAISAEVAANLRVLLEGGDPDVWINVAEAVSRALGAPRGGEFRKWLRATVGSFAAAVGDRAVLEALARLGDQGATLATVNYDDLLESATGLRPATWLEPARVERVLHGDERAVLHLHGHWAAPESVVLGVRSYDEVVRDEHARSVLRSLRMQRVLVFVGHGAGLADPNWGSFLRWSAAVHAESEYRNYRLVRDCERAQVQAEHPPEQRIFAVPYGAAHADLGPFLRALVPASSVPAPPEAPAAATGGDVVLWVSVGAHYYKELSHDSVRRQLGARVLDFCDYKRQVADPALLEQKDWQIIARELDDLVERAEATARRFPGPVRLVVVGTAPAPVFGYLGLRMNRCDHPIAFLNRQRNTEKWDLVTAADAARSGGRDDFTSEGPHDVHRQPGRAVLSLRCSPEFPYDDGFVRPMIEDEGEVMICSYRIRTERSQTKNPLAADDMGAVIHHIERGLGVLAEKCPGSRGFVLAFGGPSWVIFWVAYRLNPNPASGRIDIPNYLGPARGYVPALAWPMHQAPWIAGKLRVLVLVAEPDDAVRLAAARECDAIREAIEQVRGKAGAEVVARGATRAVQIQRIIAEVRPHILHVSAHGSAAKTGELLFEDEAGNGQPLAADTFIEMLRASAGSLVAVVASVCYWAPYAAKLTQLAKFVVATDAEFPYKAAIPFAESFYGEIARGEALGTAFSRAKNDARAAYPVEGVNRLEASHAHDVEPDKLVLLSPVRGR